MKSVRIDTLTAHPDNPRRGDINSIIESLEAHGQYRPIVVNKATNHIITGNHTTQAAKKLGWTHIDVVYVDVDESTERAILLADNRLSDRATYNEDTLQQLLDALPDLTGTGFTEQDAAEVNEPSEDTPPVKPEPPDEPQQPTISLGFTFQGTIDEFEYDRWADTIRTIGSKRDIIQSLRIRLAIPTPAERQPVPRGTTPTPTKQAERVPLNTLTPHPLNPRDGDIGAISESLATFGQYKPIVITTEGIIIAGNHVAKAAHQLGWTHIEAVRLNVDEEQAVRILLADNRTADLATYDTDHLRRLLLSVNLTGTGWEPADVNDILNGAPPRHTTTRNRKTRCVIGEFTWSEPTAAIHQWTPTVTQEDIAHALGIPPTAITWT